MGKKINIVSKKFGKLTVLEEFHERDKSGRSRLFAKCICDCGHESYVEKSKLLGGRTKSCGCIQKESRKSLGAHFKKEYGEAAFNECYSAYKKSAKLRSYSFELSKEEFKQIITQPCIYCGESLTQEKKKKGAYGTFKYTGIDRYDNTKGYTIDNCVPCCSVCNRIKTDMAIEDMEKQLTKIISRKSMWKRIA